MPHGPRPGVPGSRPGLAAYLLLTALGTAGVFAYVAATRAVFWFFEYDAWGYITEARNFLAGLGFVRAAGLAAGTENLAPQGLFPIGYPALIALASLTGLSPESAAFAVTRSAWALLLPAIVWATYPILGRVFAVAAALCVATSPGMQLWGPRPFADVPATLALVMSTGFVVRGLAVPGGGRRHWGAAGLAAGAAIALRNAAVAMPLATVLLLCLGGMRAVPGQRRLWLACGTAWATGVALVVLPLMARNVIVFGAIQPWQMTAQSVDLSSALAAVRNQLWNLLIDLTGIEEFAAAAWDGRAALALLLALAAAVAVWGRRAWRQSDRRSRMSIAFLLAMAAVSTVVIDRAVAKYLAADTVRYVLQFSWALVVCIAWVARHAVAAGRGPSLLGAAVLALAAGLGHAAFHVRQLDREAALKSRLERGDLDFAVGEALAAGRRQTGWMLKTQLFQALSREHVLLGLVAALPAETFIISNEPEFLGYASNRPVRGLPIDRGPTPLRAALGPAGLCRQRACVLVLLPGLPHLRTGSWQTPALEVVPEGWHLARRDPRWLLLANAAARAQVEDRLAAR